MFALGLLGFFGIQFTSKSENKLVSAFPDVRWDRQVSETSDTEENLALVAEYDFDALSALAKGQDRVLALVDSGATLSIGGRRWLESVEQGLLLVGLQPIKEKAKEVFNGLGGTKRQATEKWTFPAGIFQAHATVSFYLIEGDMIGLLSRRNLDQ